MNLGRIKYIFFFVCLLFSCEKSESQDTTKDYLTLETIQKIYNVGDNEKSLNSIIAGKQINADLISEYLVRDYLLGDAYDKSVDVVEYLDTFLVFLSEEIDDMHYKILDIAYFKKMNDENIVSFKLVKQNNSFREDIVVIVNNFEESIPIKAFYIDVNGKAITEVSTENIQLVQEEF